MLANGNRTAMIAKARGLLAMPPREPETERPQAAEPAAGDRSFAVVPDAVAG